MNTPHNLTRIIAGALLSGGVAVAGLGQAGTAQAGNGPNHWCPGDSMVYQPTTSETGPGIAYDWDMNICHTWYRVANAKGNVPYKGRLPSDVWDGDNPPPLQPLPPQLPLWVP